MSSRLADSLELCYDLRGALKEMRAGNGELESVLDGIFDELPGKIEGIAAGQRDVEQSAADDYQQETDRFRQQIAAVVEQLKLVQREQSLQATELQTAHEHNAGMAEELADQRRQTRYWQETAQQKLAEIEGIAASQREVEQTTADSHRQESDQLRQEIAELLDQMTLVQRDRAGETAELQTAREQNAALADEIADQRRQTQQWQVVAEQKVAESEAIAEQQRELERTTAATHQQETDQFRQQIAELAGQQALVERDQALQAAELQSAREQSAALADELADQKRQSRHWQEVAEQKLADAEGIAAHQREVEQTIAANHQRETDELRRQIAELLDRQRLNDRQLAAQAADAQAARGQNSALEEQLADQHRQSQHWQQVAQQKLAEIEEIAARQREVEQMTAASHQQAADELRRQIAELVDQQALIERDRAAQTAELQSACQQNAAMTEELANQKRQMQRWQEMAKQKLAEIEQIAAQQCEAERTAAANYEQETERVRRQIAAVVDHLALVQRDQAAHSAELQTAREQNAAMAEKLADQQRQTQHWQQAANQNLGQIETITAQQRQVEQTTAANHRQETDQLRQRIAALIDRQTLVERELAASPAELQAAHERNAAMADELAEQRRQAQRWQEMAQQKLGEIEGLAVHQREVEQSAVDQQQETDRFRQQIAELIDQQALVRREQAIQAAELQAAQERNAAMADELADQRLQTQRWQEMANCAKQVTELRALFEHRQACQEAQALAADEQGSACESNSADLGRRVDRREDSARSQPAHSDSVARQTPADREASSFSANGDLAESPEEFSTQDRLMAQHQAQWEELLRTRSKAHR
jgi:hypothetical protein